MALRKSLFPPARVLAVLLAALLAVVVQAKRGRRIDIGSQAGGDITQLMAKPSLSNGVPVMFNALPSNSPFRWTVYTDAEGNYVIPYVITGTFDSEEQDVIRSAMRAIEGNTCIRFSERADQKDYLELHNERNQGCYTTVGRQSGKNIVMLEANNLATCVEKDIVIHELMHTIGLWHEQMRYDRDKYIKVHYENIEPVYYPQFDKISEKESTTYGITYDYRSVMHYAKDAFGTRPNIVTMETLDPKFQEIIGRVRDASPSDYLKICSIYACKQCMGKPFTNQTIAEYERSRNENDTASTSKIPPTLPPPSPTQKPSTRATRLTTLARITAPPTLGPIVLPSTSKPRPPPPDCKDKFFCVTLLNAWNRDFMCRLQSMQTWCCRSCTPSPQVAADVPVVQGSQSRQQLLFQFGLAE